MFDCIFYKCDSVPGFEFARRILIVCPVSVLPDSRKIRLALHASTMDTMEFWPLIGWAKWKRYIEDQPYFQVTSFI